MKNIKLLIAILVSMTISLNSFSQNIDITDADANQCSGIFWDSGINGNYSTGENETITICSNNGGAINFNFIDFNLGSSSDKLKVYDGPDTDAPLIGNYDNANSLEGITLTSTGTCLTFTFTSSTWGSGGEGWAATINCNFPCQDFELDVVSVPEADELGVIHSCPGESVDLTADLTFPNNGVSYTQSVANSIINWTAYNGATGTGATFNLPTDSAFTTEVIVDVEDVNGCHVYDTINIVSECQAIDLSIATDAAVVQNGEIFLPDFSVPIALDGSYSFPENNECYNQELAEITWTWGISDPNNAGAEIESHAEDTTIQYETNGVYEIILNVEDQVGCSNSTSVEVHVGCQPVDVSFIGTPAMLGDTIIVCPGDSFGIEIFTDYFANNTNYFQEDANMIFNWNMADGTLIDNQMQPGNHMYSESGLYTAYLQIVDTNSGSAVPCVDNTYFNIYAFMEPSLEGTHMIEDTICFGESIVLTGNTTLDMPTYSAPPIFLPDGSGVSYESTLTFDMFGDEILTDVNDFLSICMNLEHSYTGDLRLELECPNGQTVELLPYPNGCGGDHLGEPCDWGATSTIGVGYDYCFTPFAATTIPDNSGLFNHTFTDNDNNEITSDYFPAGDYAPTGTFDDLLGCPLNGDWTLNITDNLGSDDGMIFDWSITLNLDGLIPPDTTQLPLDMREWTVATGNGANFELIDEDDYLATPLDTGIYEFTFTVTSPAGCAYDTTVGPLYVAPMPTWTLGNDTNVCSSYDFTIPGSLSGGNGTWSYEGPAGATATFSDPTTIPTDVSISEFGDYIFYFTPNTIALCATPDQIAVSFHELPIVSEIIDSTQCFGACDGVITLDELGVEGPYSYFWSNGDLGNVANDLCIGNHQVTVSSEYCSTTFDYNVHQPTQLVIFNSGKVDNLCYAETDGEMWVVPSGGTPGYTYNWSSNGNPNVSSISNLSGGEYSVTVSDFNNCTTSISYTIEEPEAPLVIDGIYPTDVACNGENSGSLDISITGGTPGYTYNWLLANGSISTAQHPENLIAGNYFVTVTDHNGCDTTSSQVVSEPTELIETHFTTPASCYSYADGKAWIIPSGGTAPYSYLWSNGSQDSVLVNATGQTYLVTVTDAQNCTLTRTMEVEQPLEVMLNIVPTPILCVGESVDLIMSVTSSPFAPYTYYWNGAESTETIEVSPQETTTYTAKVVDSQGCESLTLTETVEVYQPISTNFSTDKTEVCAGEIVIVDLVPSGGNGDYTYSSLEGEPLSTHFSVQPEQTKTYGIIISDGCTHISDTVQFEITVHEPYSPSFNAVTKQGCVPLSVDFIQNTDEHAEGTSYLWNFGDESSSSISYDPQPRHEFDSVGNLNVSLEIVSPKGCKSEKIEYAYISVFPVPSADFYMDRSAASTVDPSIFFENSSIGGDIWQWNFGDGDSTYAWNTEHIFPNYQMNYNVELVALNNYGCSDTIYKTIRIVDEVTLHIPTGFTPDGDGKNEVFRPYGNAISEDNYSMTIFNRWGEVIFETTNINEGWNGIVKGGSLGALGIYTYVIQFTDSYGIPHERSGQINLIR